MKMTSGLAFLTTLCLALALYQLFFIVPASVILKLFGAFPGYGEEHVARILFVTVFLIPIMVIFFSKYAIQFSTRKGMPIAGLLVVSGLVCMIATVSGLIMQKIPYNMLILIPLMFLVYLVLIDRLQWVGQRLIGWMKTGRG
ncbi:MAG: hypothetical protein ABI036_03315 [Fibrobacteria bacterium]